MPASLPLRHRTLLIAAFWLLAALGLCALALSQGLALPWAVAIGALTLLPLCVQLARQGARISAMYRAMAGTVDSYRDGDFSFSLAWPRQDELGTLVAAHNRLGEHLRAARHALAQRELLLDTVVQNTPVATVLLDGQQHVVLANLAARKLLGNGRKLEGLALAQVLKNVPEALAQAIDAGADALLALPSAEAEEEDILHLSCRHFHLNGRPHRLLLLRQMTRELRRQEVATWKKVIRIISHELNNSLAPMASLAHSGQEMLRRGQYDKLPLALATIEERTRHLEGFLRDYARFAKLPTPRLEHGHWPDFLARLAQHIPFHLPEPVPEAAFRADPAQLSQALINLIKNAHESGSPAEAVELRLHRQAHGWHIEVLDRGSGMNAAILAQALLPFYSTKRHGTGLGLALAREIIEAHGGHISLANREGGGLAVILGLPD